MGISPNISLCPWVSSLPATCLNLSLNTSTYLSCTKSGLTRFAEPMSGKCQLHTSVLKVFADGCLSALPSNVSHMTVMYNILIFEN